MNYEELLAVVSDEPVFAPGLLMAAGVSEPGLQRQLSRWVRAGKLLKLRRGLYAVAPPFAKRPPHPFLVANRLRKASYVTLQSALAHHGLIPEHVPVVTSVTTARPGEVRTPLGRFVFRHVKTELLFGYRLVEVGDGQSAFVATPEKCVLDLVYLTPHGAERAYLKELRLQNLSALDPDALAETAEAIGGPKMRRAARHISDLAEVEERDAE